MPPAGASSCNDLLSAFRQDVTVTRYATWDDVLDYCRRSANPVGRLVLRIAGYDAPALDADVGRRLHGAAADEFWQDSRRLAQAAGCTCPRTIWQPAGAREADLDARAS